MRTIIVILTLSFAGFITFQSKSGVSDAEVKEMYIDSLERAYINHIKIDSFRLQTIRKYAPIALECNANH